jgi:hypothetical protein
MKRTRIIAALIMLAALAACDTEPVAPPPPPPPPPTIEEQIAAWKPRIVVEEPMAGFNPSLEIATTTPGDTICYGTAQFRIDSANVPDSVVWSLGAGIYTTKRFSVSDIPDGLHIVQATVRKRFISPTQNRDTVVERSLERTFVCLDYSASLTIGKWVPVDPTETRIDTLRVIYQEIVPGSLDRWPMNYVLGATRGCDSARLRGTMYLVMRRYAVNFERRAKGGKCQALWGELALEDRLRGTYRYFERLDQVNEIRVRRVQ